MIYSSNCNYSRITWIYKDKIEYAEDLIQLYAT